MIFRLIDFAFVVLYLLMFKFCGIIEISKIEFFNFSGTEWVKQNQKKKHSKPPNSNRSQTFFWFFTENLSDCFFVCFLPQPINFVTKMNMLFGYLILFRIVGKTTLNQGVIIPQ